jgi:3-oxoacyl-[acyl-carrier protein] reductase
MTEEQFDQVIAVNLKGVWNLTRLIGPLMQSQKSGSIINISSVVGIYGNIGQVNYSATKAGVIGMTKSWAKEFSFKGGNVRVNAVAPGYTMTDMMKTVSDELLEVFKKSTMLGRLAKPEEIANAVLFLASDMASYITGEVLNVNGGMRL